MYQNRETDPKGILVFIIEVSLSNYSAGTVVFFKTSLYNQSLETDEGKAGQPNPRLISMRLLCLSCHAGKEKQDIAQSLEDKQSLTLKDKIY